MRYSYAVFQLTVNIHNGVNGPLALSQVIALVNSVRETDPELAVLPPTAENHA